jgi:hypothetical protein
MKMEEPESENIKNGSHDETLPPSYSDELSSSEKNCVAASLNEQKNVSNGGEKVGSDAAASEKLVGTGTAMPAGPVMSKREQKRALKRKVPVPICIRVGQFFMKKIL